MRRSNPNSIFLRFSENQGIYDTIFPIDGRTPYYYNELLERIPVKILQIQVIPKMNYQYFNEYIVEVEPIQ